MWSDTRLARLLGLELPIVQSPMLGSSTPELAAAVSNAGGLGSIACASMTPEALSAAIADMRGRTNGAFNANFFAHKAAAADPDRMRRAADRLAPYYAEFGLEPPHDLAASLPPAEPGFSGDVLAALESAPPPVVSFHFGLPEGDAVARLRAAGSRVIATATTVAEARALEEAGCDAIIAQGWEAGGHRGAFEVEDEAAGIGLMSLIPLIVDAVSAPVIAAGGVADGRGVAAALALGAEGVQIGTAFLGCPEVSIPEKHRRAISASTGADTRLTRSGSGRPARGLSNRYAREMTGEADIAPFPLQRALTQKLRDADQSESMDFQFLLYGQSAPLNRAMPAADLVRRIAEETEAALNRAATRS
jgi:nitronate monooxygenase